MRTAFDRWLIKKFTVETQIFTVNDPGPLPQRAKRIELDENHRSRYRYKFVTHNSDHADQIIDFLRDQHMSFNTQLKERRSLFARFINPDGRSFTFTMISRLLVTAIILSLLYLGYLAIFEHRFDEELKALFDFFSGDDFNVPTEPIRDSGPNFEQ